MAIVTFTNHIYKSFDNNEFTLAICLDFSKAFDTIDHTILLAKLAHYGIVGTANDWFRSYLTGRKQFVSYLNSLSSNQLIDIGVPQGSLLGPLLFLIYINDIVNSASRLQFLLYADDSNLYISGHDVNNLITIANQDLINVNNWLACNKLSLNISKSHYVIFNRNKTFPPSLNTVMIDSQPLSRQSNTKFLGVLIDEKLNWKDHVLLTQNKLNKQCGILYHTRGLLSREARQQVYMSLIYPYLTYCNTVWGSACQTTIAPITTAQKRVIRTISELRKFDHTNDEFCKMKLLKFTDINIYCCALFVYKSLASPDNSFFIRRNNARYAFRVDDLLNIPLIHSKQSESCILYHGVKIWNDLPAVIRNSQSLAQFKTRLKSHLLSFYSH